MRPIFSTLRSRLLLSSAVSVLLFVGAALVAFVTIQRLLQTLDLEQHSQRLVGARERHLHGQPETRALGNHLEPQPRLLADQAFEALGVGLDRQPNRMQGACQIRSERQVHRQDPVIRIVVPQSIPRQT